MRRVPSPSQPVVEAQPTLRGALAHAQSVSAEAAAVGFDWDNATQVRLKVDEELAELDEAMLGGDVARVLDELGDVLFTLVNLARHLGVPAESALSGATAKFERRFRSVEAQLSAAGRTVQTTGTEELEECWQRAKLVEEGG
ncbi:MAG: ATP diphosphatase [Myxococcota bacterium]|jgi:ATP diphosphatase